MGVFWAVVGLVMLIVGAESLVRGASRLAQSLGVSALVIGLTVVAFGTSAPEVAVSIRAVFAGQDDLSIGNAVGSNTFNVLFILGASAIASPLVVAQKLVRVDVPIMIATSVLFWLLARDGALTWIDGGLLLSALIAYTGSAIVISRRESAAVLVEYEQAAPRGAPPKIWRSVALVVIGLGVCVIGANLLVSGASSIARALGVSELVIGLTIVAAGTSLPEAATSIMAAIRGQRDIAVGNIVGSNIFNLLGILGLAGLLAPDGVSVSAPALSFDIPVMTAVCLVCLPICFTGHRINRPEGMLLLALYALYVTFLLLQSARHDALERFGTTVLWFVLPIAGLGVGASVVHALLGRSHSGVGPG